MLTAILRVSDAVSRREAPDVEGPELAALVEAAGGTICGFEVLPDDYALIEDRIHHFLDEHCRLVLTVGGIGPSSRHVTPEATRAVVERDAPGVAEAIRAAGRAVDPASALLWRGTAGWRAGALVVNLPDQHVGAVFAAVAGLLPAA